MDTAAVAATLRPPSQIFRPEGFSKPLGSVLVLFNHYSRRGVPAWWTVFVLGGALVQIGLTEPEPRWVMTAAWRHWGVFAPASRWILRRIAKTYHSFLMPPMPPAPEDAPACAATVRQVIHFARGQRCARVCLAPEGRDSGDGSLIEPPPGAGRFIWQLCRAGLTILPAGVCEEGGAWRVRFGAPFTLTAPDDLSPDERDTRVSLRVMRAMADLLPRRLRGSFVS